MCICHFSTCLASLAVHMTHARHSTTYFRTISSRTWAPRRESRAQEASISLDPSIAHELLGDWRLVPTELHAVNCADPVCERPVAMVLSALLQVWGLLPRFCASMSDHSTTASHAVTTAPVHCHRVHIG